MVCNMAISGCNNVDNMGSANTTRVLQEAIVSNEAETA